jgi:hypothetical protein
MFRFESSNKIAKESMKEKSGLGTCPFVMNTITCADLCITKDGSKFKPTRKPLRLDKNGITMFDLLRGDGILSKT